ncbi:MAG: pilus assembly protein PilZ [Devosia sp.]|nr:pilus assembly protein PilZ [Devosia sp.]
MNELRRAPRHRTLKKGHIIVSDGFSTIDCLVRNLSDTGAQLKVASVLGIPDSFPLKLSDGQTLQCRVAWKRETEIGVEFITA